MVRNTWVGVLVPGPPSNLVLGAKARAASRGDALPNLDGNVRAVAPAVLGPSDRG